MMTRTFYPHPFPEAASPLDFLLCQESSAVDAYSHALQKGVLARHPEPLRELLAEHQLAARHLRDYAPCEFQTAKGAWPRLPRVVDAGSRFHIREAILWALQDAESRSVHDYEECLESDDIPDECKGLIRTELLPKAKKHVHRLDELIRFVEEEVEL